MAPVDVVMVAPLPAARRDTRQIAAANRWRLQHRPCHREAVARPDGMVHLYVEMPFTGCEPTASNRQSELVQRRLRDDGTGVLVTVRRVRRDTEITACTGSGVARTAVNGALGIPGRSP